MTYKLFRDPVKELDADIIRFAAYLQLGFSSARQSSSWASHNASTNDEGKFAVLYTACNSINIPVTPPSQSKFPPLPGSCVPWVDRLAWGYTEMSRPSSWSTHLHPSLMCAAHILVLFVAFSGIVCLACQHTHTASFFLQTLIDGSPVTKAPGSNLVLEIDEAPLSLHKYFSLVSWYDGSTRHRKLTSFQYIVRVQLKPSGASGSFSWTRKSAILKVARPSVVVWWTAGVE